MLKPVEPDALELALERALEGRALRREVRYLRGAVAGEDAATIGESAPWRRAIGDGRGRGPVDAVVLITGESGTGKELLARRLHALSARAAGPFVKVNCAAVPIEMWESEFFGHRKGSFTGASADRDGRFQLADRGTLLLDEVGAMPAAGQAKLLRAIQDGEFERLGDQQATRVDVRVVASTNSDLEAEVQQGRFRADLFYRLNVVRDPGAGAARAQGRHPAARPPLRRADRDAAGPAGAGARAGDARAARGLPLAGQRARAAQRHRARDDPRPGARARGARPGAGRAAFAARRRGPRRPRPRTCASRCNRLERELLLEAQRRAGGVRKQAAHLLGIDPRNLAYYLHKHGIAADGTED